MREIFTRLLKALWILNIFYIVGGTIFYVGAVIIVLGFMANKSLYGLEEEVAQFIGIFLLAVVILLFLQYVLLGNFNPKILFKRKSRYPR